MKLDGSARGLLLMINRTAISGFDGNHGGVKLQQGQFLVTDGLYAYTACRLVGNWHFGDISYSVA